MDHETAVQLKAAEGYFLGELTGEDRDAFEDHFFMCPECAEDIRTLQIFAANAKAVFREPSVPAGVLTSNRFFWLSAAVNCGLILGLGYMLLHVTPAMERELAEARAPQFVQDVPVLAIARGGESLREISSPTQRIVFSFYLREPYRTISYELSAESGMVLPRRTLPAPPREDSAESHFSISTAGLKPGVYEIRFWGGTGAEATAIGQSKFRISGAK
jgi:Putative zinc-finger